MIMRIRGRWVGAFGAVMAAAVGMAWVAASIGAQPLEPDREGWGRWDESVSGPALVTAAWVARHMNDPGVRILDVRDDAHAYFRGHIPGAVYLSAAALRGPRGGLPVQFLDPEMSAEVLRRAGVDNASRVVVYADHPGALSASMTVYALQRIGHDNVALLDGGVEAFAEGRELSQEFPRYDAGELSPRLNRSMYVTLREVRDLVGQPGVVVIDSRPAEAYSGEVETWIRNGHVPGAINVDWRSITNAQNNHELLPPAEIRRIVESAGVSPENDIVVYCGTGREATLLYHALKHVLGYPRVRLFEGSWTEWSAYPDLPVARGRQP